MFDTSGPSMYLKDNSISRHYLLGLLNSSVATQILGILAPALHFQAGAISKIPVLVNNSVCVEQKVKENINKAIFDWNKNETSWDFDCHPLIHCNTIKESFEKWDKICEDMYKK